MGDLTFPEQKQRRGGWEVRQRGAGEGMGGEERGETVIRI